jgi:predicted nucleotidyltransferase
MRLNNNEINEIKAVTHSVFGVNALVTLFGSRIDDTEKGGDIDLLINCNKTISRDELYELKLKFLTQLKKRIGDQKIDVLIDGGQQNNTVFKTVANEGILL